MEKYGLGVMLYSFLNEEEIDSPNYTIAKYILENMDSVKNYSIKEFASKCNVSLATVSRFCRKAGLENFFELKVKLYNNDSFSRPEYNFRRFPGSEGSLSEIFLDSVIGNIKILKKKLDYNVINELVDDLHRYKRVGAFGAMHMENTARSLQSDLFRCRKIINTRSGLPKQLKYITTATEKDLIIIFTRSGNYLKEIQQEAPDWKNNHKPKIYMITGNREVTSCYIDRKIVLPLEKADFAGHPLDMTLTGSIISLQYYNKYIKNTSIINEI